MKLLQSLDGGANLIQTVTYLMPELKVTLIPDSCFLYFQLILFYSNIYLYPMNIKL